MTNAEDSIETRGILIAFRQERDRPTAAGSKLNRDTSIIHGLRSSVDQHRLDLMLAIRSRLHEYDARFGLMHVDQSDADFIGGHVVHKDGDIARQAGAAMLWIEVPQSSVQRRAGFAGR